MEAAENALEQRLCDIAADLVTDDKVFIRNLFMKEKAVWLEATTLCETNSQYLEELNFLSQTPGQTLQVTWLDYPDNFQDDYFRLVLFYFDALLWTYAAICNVKVYTSNKKPY